MEMDLEELDEEDGIDGEESENLSKKRKKNQKENDIPKDEKEMGKENPKIEEYQNIGGSLFFTDIPKRKVLKGITGEDLTKMNFDKSLILRDLLSKEYDNGEFCSLELSY
jgi:hypothetical protein